MVDNYNPINNTLAATLNSLQSQINALSTARQPYISDWQAITTTTSISGAVITFTDPTFSTLGRFSVGDKIKLIQDGTTKYFNAYAVSPSSISVTAGVTYTLTGSTITSLYRSSADSPTGFPASFSFNPNWYYATAAT